ncbi:hypothetical protein BaRGS_00011590 [Batillaria attramentaria]|uniref:Uncharacterized protein n=1 Tax=Batillaria attramentaria TaxID=370345 RepID=A0ABD0LDR6_9CAEN
MSTSTPALNSSPSSPPKDDTTVTSSDDDVFFSVFGLEFTLHDIYIIAGSAGGVIIILIVIVALVVRRRRQLRKRTRPDGLSSDTPGVEPENGIELRNIVPREQSEITLDTHNSRAIYTIVQKAPKPERHSNWREKPEFFETHFPVTTGPEKTRFGAYESQELYPAVQDTTRQSHKNRGARSTVQKSQRHNAESQAMYSTVQRAQRPFTTSQEMYSTVQRTPRLSIKSQEMYSTVQKPPRPNTTSQEIYAKVQKPHRRYYENIEDYPINVQAMTSPGVGRVGGVQEGDDGVVRGSDASTVYCEDWRALAGTPHSNLPERKCSNVSSSYTAVLSCKNDSDWIYPVSVVTNSGDNQSAIDNKTLSYKFPTPSNCSGKKGPDQCKVFVVVPDVENENVTDVCVLHECLPDNKHYNMCNNVSAEVPDVLYLASHQFFAKSPDNSNTSQCRCQVTSNIAHVRPLYISEPQDHLTVTAGSSLLNLSTDHGAAGHEDHVCVTGTLDLIVANSSALVWLEIRGENSNLSLRCNEEIETNAAETVAGRKGGLCTHDVARIKGRRQRQNVPDVVFRATVRPEQASTSSRQPLVISLHRYSEVCLDEVTGKPNLVSTPGRPENKKPNAKRRDERETWILFTPARETAADGVPPLPGRPVGVSDKVKDAAKAKAFVVTEPSEQDASHDYSIVKDDVTASASSKSEKNKISAAQTGATLPPGRAVDVTSKAKEAAEERRRVRGKALVVRETSEQETSHYYSTVQDDMTASGSSGPENTKASSVQKGTASLPQKPVVVKNKAKGAAAKGRHHATGKALVVKEPSEQEGSHHYSTVEDDITASGSSTPCKTKTSSVQKGTTALPPRPAGGKNKTKQAAEDERHVRGKALDLIVKEPSDRVSPCYSTVKDDISGAGSPGPGTNMTLSQAGATSHPYDEVELEIDGEADTSSKPNQDRTLSSPSAAGNRFPIVPLPVFEMTINSHSKLNDDAPVVIKAVVPKSPGQKTQTRNHNVKAGDKNATADADDCDLVMVNNIVYESAGAKPTNH